MTTDIPRRAVHDLHRLVESEELGESLFGAAQRGADEPTRAGAWCALRELEVQTNRGVRQFIEQSGVRVSVSNRVATNAGVVGGSALVHLPWRAQLRSVRLGTHRYLPAFRRLAEQFRGTAHHEFFEYVVEHELAIIEFTDRALRSERAPLDAVHRLIDRPVPFADGLT